MNDKLIKFATDWKTIISAIIITMPLIVLAADIRYETKDSGAKREVRQILREIQDLEIQKGYADKPRMIQMIDARIKVKENQIKSITE